MRKIFFLIITIALFSCNENGKINDNKQSEFKEKTIAESNKKDEQENILSGSLDIELNKYMKEVGGILQPESMRTIYSICFSKEDREIVVFYSGLNLPVIIDNNDNNYGIIGVFRKNGYNIAIYDSKINPISFTLYKTHLLEKESIEYFKKNVLKRPTSNLKSEIWIYKILEKDSLVLLKKIHHK